MPPSSAAEQLTPTSARALCVERGVRAALIVELGDDRVPTRDAVPIQREPEQPTGRRGFLVEAIEYEIAQAVEDQLAVIRLGALSHVRVAADHRVGPGV